MMLAASTLTCRRPLFFKGWECQSLAATWKHLHTRQHNVVRTFAAKNNQRKRKNSQNKSKGPTLISEEASSDSGGNISASLEVNSEDVATSDTIPGASRTAVLEACTLTSGLLPAGRLVLRQASHFASSNGWAIADPADVSYPYFPGTAQLHCDCLPPWDKRVALSRGADAYLRTKLDKCPYYWCLVWSSALGQQQEIFICDLATFVGFAYGIGTIASSSIIVLMASHSINNIIGGLLWRFTNNSQKEI